MTDHHPGFRYELNDDAGLFFSISRELKPSTPARVRKAPRTFLGKVGSIGLEVLDTFGSSLTNLLPYSGFVSNPDLRGRKVSLLAFEVANTIVKGSNLMQSLTEEYIQNFKTEILLLKGVQLLVSTDIKELLRIAAAEKREEFKIVYREVARFGDLCVDCQWHNLDRFFRWDRVPCHKQTTREEAEVSMQELANLAKRTAELYHELHALGRLEQVYERKLEDVESLGLPQKGESLMILQNELKLQRKLVRSLQKQSLWTKSLEEIVEKLVVVCTFINQEVAESFVENVSAADLNDETDKKTERLGLSGLALHYANLIAQIDNIASHPTSLHPNTRDRLYNSLPTSVRARLRSGLLAFDSKEVMTMPQIKAEMDKTLQWLVPLATDTTKAHQSFGWVGEWANTGFEFGNISRLQTLYHADKHKMDQYILDLIILLHCLINLANGKLRRVKISLANDKLQRMKILQEAKDLLEEVNNWRNMFPGESKSQDFAMGRKEEFASCRGI